jgi:hypothetical protein
VRGAPGGARRELMADGLHSQLKLLRSDCAGKIGLEPAPCNSLRALRPLRSAMHGEHETNALKRAGSRPIFSAVLKIAPAGHRLPRGHNVRVQRGCFDDR